MVNKRPGFFQGHCDDFQRVHPRGHPVGHGVMDQPMPGDALQAIEFGVDHSDSKMTGATCGAGTDTAFRFQHDGELGLFYWVEDGFGCSVGWQAAA